MDQLFIDLVEQMQYIWTSYLLIWLNKCNIYGLVIDLVEQMQYIWTSYLLIWLTNAIYMDQLFIDLVEQMQYIWTSYLLIWLNKCNIYGLVIY